MNSPLTNHFCHLTHAHTHQPTNQVMTSPVPTFLLSRLEGIGLVIGIVDGLRVGPARLFVCWARPISPYILLTAHTHGHVRHDPWDAIVERLETVCCRATQAITHAAPHLSGREGRLRAFTLAARPSWDARWWGRLKRGPFVCRWAVVAARASSDDGLLWAVDSICCCVSPNCAAGLKSSCAALAADATSCPHRHRVVQQFGARILPYLPGATDVAMLLGLLPARRYVSARMLNHREIERIIVVRPPCLGLRTAALAAACIELVCRRRCSGT